MYNPERRVAQFHSFYDCILAAHEVDELWAETFSFSEDALRGRNIIVCHFYKVGTCAHLVGSLPFVNAFVIAVLLVSFHIPPTFVGAVAVNDSFSRDAYVLCVNGIDTWLVVDEVQTLPACLDIWIEVTVEGEDEFSAFANHEVYVRKKGDGTSHVFSSRNNHFPSTFL